MPFVCNLYENNVQIDINMNPNAMQTPVNHQMNGYYMDAMDTNSPLWLAHIKREIVDDMDYMSAKQHSTPLQSQSSPLPIYPIRVKQEPDCGYGSPPPEWTPFNHNESQRSHGFFTHIQDLALKECAKEIDTACEALNISADPFNWNAADVRNWLLWTTRQFDLQPFPLDYFQMDGMALCSLSETDFKQRAPNCGETLYAQLDIWKTAVDFRPEESILEFSSILSSWSSSPPPYCTSSSPPSNASAVPSPGQESMGSDILSTVCLSPVSPPMCSSPIITGYTTTGMGSPVLSPIASSTIVTSDYGSEGTQSDDDISDDGCDHLPTTTTLVEQSPPPTTGRSGSGSHIHLWQFLKELLSQPQLYGSYIRWMDRQKGVFKIEDSVRVARLWGKRKNRPAMNYDKLSRSIRQYYKKGIMKKTERSQRLVYQFCHPYCL